MAIRIKGVQITPQTANVNQSILITVSAVDNDWETIKNNLENWQTIMSKFANWQELYDFE